ncbi:MAG TPA: amidase, partial [Chromatiales bacterium]|nr:amidase [Chromatiales bacterium]
MNFEEYRGFDATGLAGLVARGEVTPRELFERAEARARELAETLNAVSVWDLDHAEAALEAGPPAGPFTGVPFLLKDLYAFLR